MGEPPLLLKQAGLADQEPRSSRPPSSNAAKWEAADGAVWSSRTYIIVPSPGGKLALKAQSLHIQQVLRTAIHLQERHFMLQDSFPDREPLAQDSRNLVIDAAREHDEHEVKDRLRKDATYSRWMASVVSNPYCFIKNCADYAIDSRVGGFPCGARISKTPLDPTSLELLVSRQPMAVQHALISGWAPIICILTSR